ncbi:MAG: hypothetical protein CVU34_11850 [Betaproteobacteria bacterium HGW-Betaproteobacteria-7]|nr:MAG: hypothetical protein CVU34_11850 [Betaproteobacteria bacterium HGW-Betaproteobacteria-7]
MAAPQLFPTAVGIVFSYAPAVIFNVALRSVLVFLVAAAIRLFDLAIVEVDLGTVGRGAGTGIATKSDVGDLRFGRSRHAYQTQ